MTDLSSWAAERFNEYSIVCAELNKKLRQTFRPVVIIYEPVERPDEIIN